MRFNFFADVWQFWSLTALALMVVVALITDLRDRRIPNAVVLVTLCAGVLVHVLGPEAWKRSAGLFTAYPGALGVKGALFGALTGLGIFLPFYALRAMGAGDVKLMAGIGSFAGPADTLNLALFILSMGGVLALGRMLWAGSSRRVLGNLMLMLLPVFHGGPRVFDPATQSVDRMPYTLAIAAGLLAYGAWLWLGGPAPFRF